MLSIYYAALHCPHFTRSLLIKDLRSAYVTRFSMHAKCKAIFPHMFPTLLHCNSLFNSGVTQGPLMSIGRMYLLILHQFKQLCWVFCPILIYIIIRVHSGLNWSRTVIHYRTDSRSRLFSNKPITAILELSTANGVLCFV